MTTVSLLIGDATAATSLLANMTAIILSSNLTQRQQNGGEKLRAPRLILGPYHPYLSLILQRLGLQLSFPPLQHNPWLTVPPALHFLRHRHKLRVTLRGLPWLPSGAVAGIV